MVVAPRPPDQTQDCAGIDAIRYQRRGELSWMR